MKVAIPVNEDKKTVCVSLGRTPMFLLIDTEEGEKHFFENPALSTPGGAGIQAAQFIVDLGVEILLTPRCGENAAKVLEAAEVKLYHTTSGKVATEIENFNRGTLEVLQEIHVGFHNHDFENK